MSEKIKLNLPSISQGGLPALSFLNTKALEEIQQINSVLGQDLEQEKSISIADLANIFAQLQKQFADLNLPDKEVTEKIDQVTSFFSPTAFHYPKQVNLAEAHEAVKELKEALSEDDVLCQALERFVALFDKGVKAQQPEGEPNIPMNMMELANKFDTRIKGSVEECKQKIHDIQYRANALQTLLDQIHTYQETHPDEKTFPMDELSEEWQKLKDVLKEIPNDAPLYVQEQAKKLAEIMNKWDFSKKPDAQVCKEFESACNRLLEGSQKEYPEINRILELAIQLNKIGHDALINCFKQDLHLRRTLTANQKVG